MTTHYTLDFTGKVSDFDQTQASLHPSPKPTPYIFVMAVPNIDLPLGVNPGRGSSIPILLESSVAAPRVDDGSRRGQIFDIRGRIFCCHDMRVYDPAGYAFTGKFDSLSCHGTLTFVYRNVLDPNQSVHKFRH